MLCAGEERKDAKQEAGEQWEKGYDLPLKEAEQAEAATECEEIMEQIQNRISWQTRERLPMLFCRMKRYWKCKRL